MLSAREFGKALGTVAALQEERLALGCHLAQRSFFSLPRFACKDQRRVSSPAAPRPHESGGPDRDNPASGPAVSRATSDFVHPLVILQSPAVSSEDNGLPYMEAPAISALANGSRRFRHRNYPSRFSPCGRNRILAPHSKWVACAQNDTKQVALCMIDWFPAARSQTRSPRLRTPQAVRLSAAGSLHDAVLCGGHRAPSDRQPRDRPTRALRSWVLAGEGRPIMPPARTGGYFKCGHGVGRDRPRGDDASGLWRHRRAVRDGKTRGVLNWLRREARRGATIGGLCTGSLCTMAKAGLLDGKKATIHWENQDGFPGGVRKMSSMTKSVFVDGRQPHGRRPGGTSSHRPDAQGHRRRTMARIWPTPWPTS